MPTAMVATTEVCRPVTGSVEVHMEDDRERLRRSRRQRRSGSELLEFTFTFLPFLGFMFVLLNAGWAVYTRSTLQYAVVQGVRYGVTLQQVNGMGITSSVQTVVQNNSFGRLASCGTPPTTATNGWCNIYVNTYLIAKDGTASEVTTTTGVSPVAGVEPLMRVAVINNTQSLFVPFVKMPGLGTLSPISATTVSWDKVEAPGCQPIATCAPAM